MVQSAEKPEVILDKLLGEPDDVALVSFLEHLNSHEIVYLLGHLSREKQRILFARISPQSAASVIEELPEHQAADIVEDMEASDAAAILNEMPSDEQTDILWELEDENAEAILAYMDPVEAADVRRLIDYDPESAGGLMVTEFLTYRDNKTVKQIITDLRKKRHQYAGLNIKYIYVNRIDHSFAGLIQTQELLLAEPDTKLVDILMPDAITVDPVTTLDELVDFFHTHDFYAVPVVDKYNRMLGVVLRKDVLEAMAESAAYDHLESQGIVGGEELRSMPVLVRAKNRLSWLSINIILNIIAASVIAMYQDTLSAVIALAVFLPIISDMSGCSGNQAIAVSMRELSLGAVKSSEFRRVWIQELRVGLINGTVLGVLIGIAALLWKGSVMLSVVVGTALAINTLVAVSLGGVVPLLLKHRGVDPALASGPILTTITDMVGFFLVLFFASLALGYLQGI